MFKTTSCFLHYYYYYFLYNLQPFSFFEIIFYCSGTRKCKLFSSLLLLSICLYNLKPFSSSKSFFFKQWALSHERDNMERHTHMHMRTHIHTSHALTHAPHIQVFCTQYLFFFEIVFLQWDEKMQVAEKDENGQPKGMIVKTSNLNEDLGRVS